MDDIDAQEEQYAGFNPERELARMNNDQQVQHSISPIVGENADYGIGVILDTDLFDGVKPRAWGKVLATVHLSELLQTSAYENATNDNNHQWLDQNGWEHRKTYIQDVKGNIYEAWLNIARGRDRNILYEINNVRQIDKKRTAHGAVPSTGNGRGSHIKSSSSAGMITDDTPEVKQQFSFSEPTVRKQDVAADLRAILNRGGDTAELRRYVEQMERGTGNAEQNNGFAEQNNESAYQNNGFAEQTGSEAEQILRKAQHLNMGVEEYLEQNWELYDVDGQWNDTARRALELELKHSGRQYSFSNRMTDAEIQAVQNIGRKSINAFDQADIQATERFAQRYWKEMGAKSPFFRAWFGDWRVNDQTPMQIATQKGDIRGVQKNDDTGWNIQVSGQVFNETNRHTDSYNVAARQYLPYINDIVSKAVLLDSFGIDQNKPKSINSLLMHSMYAVADIGNGQEIIKLYVEEMNDPNNTATAKRAYQLQNVEKYQSQNGSSQIPASSISSATGGINTVADLFAAVKQKDSDFKPGGASVVVDSQNKPMVVYHGSADMFNIFSYGHIGSASGTSVLGDGFYFTDQKKLAKNYGNNVYACYLQMKKPYYATEADAYKLNAKALKAQKYDGVILQASAGNVYMVFDNTQIKSATDNIGTFDGADPDIQHSFSEVQTTDEHSEEEAIQEPTAADPNTELPEDVRSELPRKARDYLKRAERNLLNKMSQSLSVPWYARREFLQPMIEEISNEYLRSGTISNETIDRLFERAYEEGVVVDREFYDQYKDLKRHLQKNAVTLHESNRADIADYNDFVKRSRWDVKIVAEGGLPVDSAYRELQEMALELFPFG